MKKMIKEFLIKIVFRFHNLTSRTLKKKRDLPREPFEALNAYFDKIWVLTIPRNEQRQKFIKEHFQGLNFEFFTGADGKKLVDGDPKIDLAKAAQINGRTIRINELACTMSHLMMFEEIVKNNYSRVLIFEDDAVFKKKNGKWIQYCLERLPEDFELLYLGYRDGELRGFFKEILEKFIGRDKSDPVISRNFGKGLRTASGHDYTHAYAVSLAGAKKLLENAYPISHTADGWLEYNVLNRKVKGLITIPKIFIQLEDLGSSIHS